ncbi:enhanced serine sensitivity protein SseB C-terminal domain-containing protein [Aminipila terrae]|uniref:SseB protein C-terminal domain-containing protein n=1 Tax=Aminipila terrae TaxID=2697030 RepID=A0A6P1MBW8_9FIRM|nr:enhanced serine sensitivity protein SseB C-terminal domain-containing protein [Aminipila terrae]QHI71407.1 hypothetical protein Ami3637_02515 [Aminipila terrae]
MEERNTELIDLFKQLINEKSSESENQFFKRLTETTLWIPSLGKIQEDNRQNFAMLMTGDGKQFIPAFLHKESKLGRFTEEQLVQIPYSRLKYLVIDSAIEINGIVISPFEENIVLDRKIMEIIDSRTMGMMLRREEHSGKLKLRKPEKVPEGLTRNLKQFFANSIEVESAWILKAIGETECEEHWMLLVDFYGEKIKLFPQVAEIMKPYMKPGEKFELIQKSPEFDTNQLETTRIYTRLSNKNLF